MLNSDHKDIERRTPDKCKNKNLFQHMSEGCKKKYLFSFILSDKNVVKDDSKRNTSRKRSQMKERAQLSKSILLFYTVLDQQKEIKLELDDKKVNTFQVGINLPSTVLNSNRKQNSMLLS